MKKSVGIIFIVAVLVCTASCNRNRGYEIFRGYAQGGEYCVKADLSGISVSHKQIATQIDAILDSIDNSLSGYNKSSLLSRRNRGESITPDRHFAQVLELSEFYREDSNGAFDAAAAPLFDAWGFGFSTDSMPSAEALSTARAECERKTKLNFNAIAQGYSCDAVASYLAGLGVVNMLVDIGEIYCNGVNPSGQNWSIGIDTPFDGNNTPGASLSGVWHSDGAPHGVVTSGNYRKFYIRDGQKYAHILDPRTGYPVKHSLLSATIVAPTAAAADAIATICMVIGPEQARRYILEHQELEGYLICADSSWHSPGFPIEF